MLPCSASFPGGGTKPKVISAMFAALVWCLKSGNFTGAMKDGQILIKDADNTQFTIIKSWSKMKWSRAERMFYGPAEIELLNKLAGIVRLPGPIEAERQRLNEIAQAVDAIVEKRYFSRSSGLLCQSFTA